MMTVFQLDFSLMNLTRNISVVMIYFFFIKIPFFKEICEVEKHELCCTACKKNLCHDCSNFIHKKKKNHENFYQKPTLPISLMCRTHSNEIQIYCLNCTKFICIKCMGIDGKHFGHQYKLLTESRDEIEKLMEYEKLDRKLTLDSLKNQYTYFESEKQSISKFTKRLIAFVDEQLKYLQISSKIVKTIVDNEKNNVDANFDQKVKITQLNEENYWEFRKFYVENLIQHFDAEFQKEISFTRISLAYDSIVSYCADYIDHIDFSFDQDIILVGFNFGLGNCCLYDGTASIKDAGSILSSIDLKKVCVSNGRSTDLIFYEPIQLNKNKNYQINISFKKQHYYGCSQNQRSFTYEGVKLTIKPFKGNLNGFRDILFIKIPK